MYLLPLALTAARHGTRSASRLSLAQGEGETYFTTAGTPHALWFGCSDALRLPPIHRPALQPSPSGGDPERGAVLLNPVAIYCAKSLHVRPSPCVNRPIGRHTRKRGLLLQIPGPCEGGGLRPAAYPGAPTRRTCTAAPCPCLSSPA